MDVTADYLCAKIEEHVRLYIKCPDGYRLGEGLNIRHHFLRENIENGLIKLVAVSTHDQRADIMTKVLGKELYEHFRVLITHTT